MEKLKARKSPITFSILICNYNYGNFVGEAILSAINQDYPSDQFEVIVVDDGSTDHSIDEIKKFKTYPNLKKIYQENIGQLAAFKSALHVSKFEWICLLDSDDLFMKNKLKRVAQFINSLNKDESFICHNLTMSDDRYKITEDWFKRTRITTNQATVFDYNSSYPFTVPCGLIFRSWVLRALLEQIHPDDWKRGADNPLVWGAFILSGRIKYLHETLATYRIHGNNHFMGSDNKIGRASCRERVSSPV